MIPPLLIKYYSEIFFPMTWVNFFDAMYMKINITYNFKVRFVHVGKREFNECIIIVLANDLKCYILF